ncbi:MAG: aminotransferase class IV [Alphaproteobacteria bacterium]
MSAALWSGREQRTVMASTGFDLIETMRFEALDGFVELERHLERMRRSADSLGFRFNRHDCRNELQAATFRLTHDARVRLLLGRSGTIAIEVRSLPPRPVEPVDVALADLPIPADDIRLVHKTTDRGFYDAPRRAAGTFEIAFRLPDGSLTEGSFTNIFVPSGDRLATPAGGGLLPGILRERLIEEGRAYETRLTAADLADGFFIGNSLRGLIAARLVAAAHNGG